MWKSYKCIILLLSLLLANIVVIAQVPTNGLIGYWPFNGNANDVSGNGNNGVLGGANGGPTLTTDRFGNANSCYEFGGYNNPNWIDIPNSPSLHLDTTLSISFWVQECFRGGMDGWGSYSTTGYNYAVIARGGDGWSCPPGLWIYTSHSMEDPRGFFGVTLNNSVSNGDYVIPDFGPRDNCVSVNDCDWLHCVIVMDGRHLTFYWNSVPVMDTIFPNCVDFSATNNEDLHIGIEGDYFWNPRDGKLDDIAMYNRVLTAQEVFQLFGQFYDIQQDTTFVAIESCDSYTWNGTTYDSSGVYVQHITNDFGCDSVVELHLTILPTPQLTHSPDTIINPGDNVTLTASGADYLYWTDADDNILSSGSSLTVSPGVSTTYYITGQNVDAALANNLVVNGDFEQGNVSFTSA